MKKALALRLAAACLCVLQAIAPGCPGAAQGSPSVYDRLARLEKAVFGSPTPSASMMDRLDALESKVEGSKHPGDFMTSRLNKLESVIFGESPPQPNQPIPIAPEVSPSDPFKAPEKSADSPLTGSGAAPTSKISHDSAGWVAESATIIHEMLEALPDATRRATRDACLDRLQRRRGISAARFADKQSVASELRTKAAMKVQQGKFADALTDYRSAFSSNPTDTALALELTLLEMKLGDWPAAEQHCMAAIAADPNSVDAWCNLGEIFAQKHQHRKAISSFAIADERSGTTGSSSRFIRSSLDRTKDAMTKVTLERALMQSQIAQRLFNAGISCVPDPEIPDANMLAYRTQLLLLIADKWNPPRPKSGIVTVLTVSKTGELLQDEILRSSGDSTLDKDALQSAREIKLPRLPKWYDSDQRQFMISFDKVERLRSAPSD